MTGRDPLDVRYNDVKVGELVDFGEQDYGFRYSDDAIDAGNRYRLSVRMPVRAEPYLARDRFLPFLDGLLPEGWVRERLAELKRIPAGDTFAMLAAYGEDCAGALTFVDPTAGSRPSGVRWLEPAELDEVVSKLRVAPLGTALAEGVRISLGGVQEKLVVVVDADGRVGVPIGGTPSTHILKPAPLEPDGAERFPGIARVEHYCMSLARRVAEYGGEGLDGVAFKVPSTSVTQIAGRDAVSIERYDRTGNPVTRIHQEDGCQALGLSPADKYQKLTGQLPSFAAIADLLRTHAGSPISELRSLLQQVVLSVCAGNADLHAKNLSFLHVDGSLRLAPVYDVVSTAGYVGVNRELGLRIGTEYHIDDVDADALVGEAVQWGIGERAARRDLRAVCEPIAALARVVRDELDDAGIGHPRVTETADRMGAVAEALFAN
jgi:serine/threonine-protein kinase HipA